MAVFGGMTLTNKGLVLQGKAQAGAELNYTRIAVGDGSLSGQSVPALNGLISLKKNLPISRMRPQPPNKAVIGATLSNADITTGFFFREIGVFAQDPDVGEILYAYANAGVTADYIAAGGGSDIIEKAIDCVVIVGTAANITATIDDSLVFALQTDLDAVAAAKVDKVSGKGLSTNDYTTTEKTKLAGITTGAGGAGSATDTVIGNRTIVDTTAPASDTGTITSLLSGLAFQIKSITGAGWKTASTMTIAAIKALLDAATNAATASTLMKRDASGRAQVAAPSAAADIARKDTVDAAITTAANDASTKAAAAQAAAINAAATDATTKANAAAAASVPLTQKGAAGGVVPLNSSVKIDEIYLPDSIVGQVEYQSTWNASTNVPALPSAAAAKGWYYVVATAGTYSSID
ncbi:phage tail protein, partial [Paenibacillus graminis]|uniref:phage tail-collar fiber domain-containing protein n=1 Tax=Paenibacillus graminis TaxID=189425 RepID=UPI002DB7F400